MKLREVWLISVLLFAACRTCPRLHIGDIRTMRNEPRAIYRVLALPGRDVIYELRAAGWPPYKTDTGRVSRVVFCRSTEP